MQELFSRMSMILNAFKRGSFLGWGKGQDGGGACKLENAHLIE